MRYNFHNCMNDKTVSAIITPGLLVAIFCWESRALTIWISKGPKQNLKGPSIEIHHQFSNFLGSIGPSGKISQGPHWIFRGPGPYLRAPENPVTWFNIPWHYIQHSTAVTKAEYINQIFTHKKHLISDPHRQAVRCLLWGFGRKMIAL